MKDDLIKKGIRIKFALEGKKHVEKNIEKHLKKYLELAEKIRDTGDKKVKVPQMMGVDEDMREWSLYMLLEHNTIVNNSIKVIVKRLSAGEELLPEEKIDPKTDVMPRDGCGIEEVDIFRKSVEDYLHMVGKLDNLKGTKEIEHPVFGNFDAHRWHCMFAFHLYIHLEQAEYIVGSILKKNSSK